MLSKTPITRNLQQQKKYRENNDYCEACAKLHGIYPVRSNLELHHILGGNNRTDQIWNFIILCDKHHRKATYHNFEGINAKRWNQLFVSIKKLKGEYNDRLLLIFDEEEISYLCNEISKSDNYLNGLRFGWFNK